MQQSKGGITLERCDLMYQSEYELHMFLIDAWDEQRAEGMKKMAEKGLPGLLMGLMVYGKD